MKSHHLAGPTSHTGWVNPPIIKSGPFIITVGANFLFFTLYLSDDQSAKADLVLLPPYTHLWETWKKSSIHLVCPWGQVRVKVLSPNPQLLRLGQLLAKPRGVVPNKYTKDFKLSTKKLKSRSLLFFQTINYKLNKT